MLDINPLPIILALFVLALIFFAGTYLIRSGNKGLPRLKPGDPKNPEGFMLLAADAMRSNRLARARDLARTGLKLNPADQRTRASLLNIIGNSFAGTGAVDQAFKHFKEAVQADPSFAFPHGNLGNLHFMRQEFAQAEKEFKQALKLNPRYPDAHNNLGILYKNQKKYDLAAQSFSAALRLDPQLKVARENLEAVRKLQ